MNLWRLHLFLLCCLFFSAVAGAQTFTIKGTVSDTLNANKLRFSSVVLLNAKDSMLETFTRTKADGSFSLHPDSVGQFLLMISFPSFADYVDIVTLTSEKPVVDLGTIPMVTKSHLLTEFVFNQHIGAIKIKGDTTEYVADSFKVRDNATVEELLRKLPGLQVNKNGEVVAQGETVQKILVDGEEFFTDDPAVVTKSLQAKAVDKVQVYDAKSDNAIFTGVDDGTREKTINLQLKDNFKKGYFGKVNVGGGTDGFFENQGMLNAFKGKRKVSVFGIAANTGKMGLGWEDRDKFGGGSNSVTEVDDDGSIIRYSTFEDNGENIGWDGNFNGQGLPTAWTGGIHFSNKWLDDKLHLSSNYRYGKQNIESVSNSLTELNYKNGETAVQQYNDEHSTSFQTGERHRADLLYEWKTDSTSQLKLTGNAGYSNTRSSTNYFTTSIINGVKANDNQRTLSNDGTTQSLNANLNWRKKFSKKGRNVAISLEESYRNTTGEGININNVSYYNAATGLLDSNNYLNQLKETESRRLQLSGRVSYTEPITKIMFLELNYAASTNNSYASNLSRDKNPGASDYSDSTNMLYSSKYDFDVFTQSAGSNIRFVLKKYNFSLGGAVAKTKFSQDDKLKDKYNFNRSFTNFFPQASFSYRIPGKQMSVRANYRGNTQQPSIDQIQPLRQNTDLNNISIGNPALKQEFNHRINVNFNDYKILTGTYTYSGLGFSFVNNDISRSETIDTAGKRQYQYINVNGNYNGWLYGGYGRTIRKWDLRVGVNASANFSRVNSVINGNTNVSDNNSYTVGLNFNKDKEKKYNFYYSPSITYNQNTASVNSNITSFWSYSNDLSASVELPLKFEIWTAVSWNIREKTVAFDNNNNVFLWSAYLGKKFLKNDQLELRANVSDILNQNIGFERYANGNAVTQDNYNTIRRYGMLQLIWNFTKTGGAATDGEAAETIINKK